LSVIVNPKGHYNVLGKHERMLLRCAVSAIPRKLVGLPIVEIGAGVGGSAIEILDELAQARNPATLHTVDVCMQPPEWVSAKTNHEHTDQAEAIRTVLKGQKKVVLHVPAASMDVLASWTDALAMVFIDGAHDYKNVRQDLGWLEHVGRGGFAAFHDFGYLMHGSKDDVTRAIAQWLAERPNGWRHFMMIDAMLVLQRVS
jgi:predicted O-methyltransferase YrrM